MAGAGEEGEGDGVDDVGADEAARRQRMIEHRQRHDADRARADRGQRNQHAEDESQHECWALPHVRRLAGVNGAGSEAIQQRVGGDAESAHHQRASQHLADDRCQHVKIGLGEIDPTQHHNGAG